MPFTDKQLTCVECGGSFTYAASEQQHHQSLGYPTAPKRCQPCRDAKKARMGGGGGPGGGGGGYRGGGGGGRGGGGGGGPREMFTAPCAECGKEARVPFKPRFDRPIYCSDCFERHR